MGLDLSVIIVTWKSTEFVRNCLSSIFALAEGVCLEVIVVDNDSGDDCGRMIELEFPTVRFFQSGQNLGFAHANNLGYQHAFGRNLLFLNPDTEVIGTALERMAKFLDCAPDVGIVGARLLNSDHTVQTSCIQNFPTIINGALDIDYLRRLFPKLRFWGMRPLFLDPAATATVEVISGACLMIRRNVFAQVGGFDNGYFMYAEDVDLCFKVQKAGWRNCYVGDAIVIHHGGQSTAGQQVSSFSAVMMRESLCRFFEKYRGKHYSISYRAVIATTALIRLCVLSSVILVTLGCFHRDNLVDATRRWLKILRWSVGLEEWIHNFQRPEAFRKDVI
jgi:GT2 family glycosyltransferase